VNINVTVELVLDHDSGSRPSSFLCGSATSLRSAGEFLDLAIAVSERIKLQAHADGDLAIEVRQWRAVLALDVATGLDRAAAFAGEQQRQIVRIVRVTVTRAEPNKIIELSSSVPEPSLIFDMRSTR
jgi:hypothetical protein